MTVQIGLNFSQFSQTDLSSYSVYTEVVNGFQSLTCTTTDVDSVTKIFNIYTDANGNPKINVNGNIFDFQTGVTTSLFDNLNALSSLMIVSTDGNPCALRLSSNTTGDPRVIFSGTLNDANAVTARVALLADAFSVFNNMSSVYTGTFIAELPSLDGIEEFTISGGLNTALFEYTCKVAGTPTFQIKIEYREPITDNGFTFNKTLTIDDFSGQNSATVYDVTDNFQFDFAQNSALIPVNDLEFQYDITAAVSATDLSGAFDGFRLQLFTPDDSIVIGSNSWSANPYDAIIDINGLLSRRDFLSMTAPANASKRIVAMDQLKVSLSTAKARQDLMKNFRL